MGAMGGAAGGAMGGLGAAGGAAGGPGAMAGGWQMPAITGGTSNLYAAPGATGAMAPPPAAPSPSWLQDHPQVRAAMLKFGQDLLQQRQAPGPGGPGLSRGQWQPPMQQHPGLPQSSSLPGPDTGAMGGPIGGMGGYSPYGAPGGRGPFWGGM
jgi:hypothetical protein